MKKKVENTIRVTWPRKSFISLLTMAVLMGGFGSTVTWATMSPYDWAFVHLDYVRQEKVTQLRGFCNRIHTLARQAAQDPLVVTCFDINLQMIQAETNGPVPPALKARVADLREGFDRYYIENYLAFYDILFVDVQGKVFYSIRKESDLHENLLQGHSKESLLVTSLRTIPKDETFVGFHNYGPSSEPAAFFIEPMLREGVPVGWVVLQWAINKVNSLFAWTEDLGRTGETFLVNPQGYMLTESNFEGASTILTKCLDDRNIQAKFADRQGHRTVTDYRGQTAFTSFEVVEFLGTAWLVVAKVDVDDVITQHYGRHRRYYADRLLRYLREVPLPASSEESLPAPAVTLRIDMDEFRKAHQGERLHTFGISTCTGLLATYPGKFAYLAHVSSKDRVYGGNETNLLGQMVKKIKSFDIYPSELRRLRFVLVAPHQNSQLTIIDKLIEEGFLLSQIEVLYNATATSATLSYDYLQNNLVVTWKGEGPMQQQWMHGVTEGHTVGSIIQEIMQADQDLPQSNNEENQE